LAAPTQIGLSTYPATAQPLPAPYFTLLVATGLLNTLIAAFFFLRLPADHHPSLTSLTLRVNGAPIATWAADANLPSTRPNGDNSTRKTIPNIPLNPGDTLTIEAIPDGPDPAALDYIEITPVSEPGFVLSQ